jgi:hypothetical protein
VQFAFIRTKARRYSIVSVIALPALLGLPLQSQGTSSAACQVHATNYLGWKAEELSNLWVKLEIVPQIGGRLIQVTFGGHDFLYVNPLLEGKVIPLERKEYGDRNYGGDKIWPMPEGNQDEQHWSGGGNLDGAPFTLQVLSTGHTCAVRLTGPVDPEIGQRYIRDISIGADTPVISFHVVMQNMSGYPRIWSEQTITEYPTSHPSGSDNFNTKFWGVTEVNPTSAYLNGYHVRTGPADNPAITVQNGTFRVHWNNIMQEVWIDSPSGWLAAVDGSTGYTMVERHRIDPSAVYPGKGSIIFYSTGEPTPPPVKGQNTEPREGPFMEAEMNSPMIKLAPGESYAMDTQWYPTRMGEDFKTTTYSGVIGTPLTAAATPAGLVLSGNFGVFYAGDLVAHLYGREASSTVKLMSVVPSEPVHLHTILQAPPNTIRVSVHLVDSKGLDRGPLGEVHVLPASLSDGTNAR